MRQRCKKLAAALVVSMISMLESCVEVLAYQSVQTPLNASAGMEFILPTRPMNTLPLGSSAISCQNFNVVLEN